ncbi:MAG TPA: aldo/keto reductase [Bacteroidales bacterium]|nr:aldo/keto reductase [Bacteroidales bacterium]
MKRIDRRGFLKTSVAGAAGITVFNSLTGQPSALEGKTITRTLGKTGIVLPVISFGVMNADNPNLCKAAYEQGIKLFDTANRYQNGNNEIMLGNLFSKYPRDSFHISTKIKPDMDNEGRPTRMASEEDFIQRFGVSLTRLKTDYVDILYIHDVRHVSMLEHKPVMNALKKLKSQGKVRFVGFSTHVNEPVVINAASEMDLFDVILTSYNYMQTYADKVTEAIHKAARSGIGIVAMKTIAGGGFLDRAKTRPVNTSASIKWVLSNQDVCTTIPGMTDFSHLEQNVKLLTDITLSESEKKDLIATANKPGFFCTECTNCLKQCSKKLPVNDLVRAYMYAYGYSDISMASSLLSELNVGVDPCRDCGECRVQCTKRFNVRERISDVTSTFPIV